MPIFYYGIHPTIAFLVALVWAILSIYLFFRAINSQRATKNHGYALLGSVMVVSILLYIADDLREPISQTQAIQLDKHLKTSIEYGSLGYEFRKAMGDLAEANGIVTTSDLSHVGNRIYMTYITKQDWNNLAKVYNRSNLPKSHNP